MQLSSSPNGQFVQHFLAQMDQISDRFHLSVPPIVDLEELRQLPVGSLGRSLADHLDQYQLQPFTQGPRRKQLHDLVHVLTGYDTSPMGEAEVQAFLLGAQFHVLHILLGLGTLRLIYKHTPHHPEVRQRIWQAYQRGRASRYEGDRWHPEEQWELPLSVVQERFQIS